MKTVGNRAIQKSSRPFNSAPQFKPDFWQLNHGPQGGRRLSGDSTGMVALAFGLLSFWLMRRLVLILLLFGLAFVAFAGPTNYFCVVCGKGPLTGRVWISKWGPICSNCMQLENRCSLCGLPIRPNDGAVKTGDGRFICRFCRTNAVLDEAGAKEVFADARHGLSELFGSGFALQYPDVQVKLFDVDYWSERGRLDGLHKFGFSSTRKTANGDCTHEVVLLSGRLRTELEATAAHEYTHLWINENCPAEHKINGDVVEAICELTAYKLMEARAQTNQMREILANPYTHGEIKKLIALDQERGTGWIFHWVKHGITATPDVAVPAITAASAEPMTTVANLPHPLPATLKLDGVLLLGKSRRAIISGQSFAPGETQEVKLQDRSVSVHCVQIGADKVKITVNGNANPVELKMGDGS